MNTVDISDLVQASASYRGRTVASISASGFASINDVLAAVCRAAGGVSGLLQLSVRNATQGWRQQRALFIAPEAV